MVKNLRESMETLSKRYTNAIYHFRKIAWQPTDMVLRSPVLNYLGLSNYCYSGHYTDDSRVCNVEK